jgi:transcriptional regulator with XRE-family HTH domain
MARPSSPTVSRRELANTLRQMRQRARKTLEEAAAALEVSAATLSRIETGVRVPRARDVKDLCEFYGITDPARIASMIALVADAKESGWWEAYSEVDDEYATFIGLEAAAIEIDQFENAMIPAFMQTSAYGEAYLEQALNPTRKKPFSVQDIRKRSEVRTRRQQLLKSTTGPHYSIIFDEAAFHRVVGSAEIMHEQIAHLIAATERPETEILVLPFNAGAHPGQQGTFTILTLPQTQVSDVVYLDLSAGQWFLEFQEEVDRYRKIFATLREAAFDAAASLEAMHTYMAAFNGPHREPRTAEIPRKGL